MDRTSNRDDRIVVWQISYLTPVDFDYDVFIGHSVDTIFALQSARFLQLTGGAWLSSTRLDSGQSLSSPLLVNNLAR